MWTGAHLFGINESMTSPTNTQLLQSSKQFAKSLLQQLNPEKDDVFYTHYQQDLCYLEKLHQSLETTSSERSAGFSTPVLQVATALPHNSPFQKSRTIQQPAADTGATYKQPLFRAHVNLTRTLPKDLLSELEPGYEIQWSQLTQATLDEFPHIDDKLKLKSLMHQMTHHKTARQAASAQLLQAIRDPTHKPLQAFFTWLQQSNGLTKQEQHTCLRKAINDQKFDWRNNPAIDLQNAISQAHVSLPEINSNEIFRETLKDALNYKLQPHYHLVADVKLSDLPDKLRHIWKAIAVP